MNCTELENRSVLNLLFWSTTNTTISIYDRAVAALFTVDAKRVARSRHIMQSIIRDYDFI